MSDAAFCEAIVRRHARTFTLASVFLPREKRRGAYAVYAFCRTADDIVDLPSDIRQHGQVRERLEAYRAAMTMALVQVSTDPVLRELAWAVARFGIPHGVLNTLIDGVAADLEPARFRTWAELQRYCQGVASTVGEMCAAVFGAGPGQSEERVQAHARTLGVAMQLTNILRDVGEDARRGRCYLPEEDLVRFGLSAADVLAGNALRVDGAWASLMAFEVARARDLYRESIPGIGLLARDAQRCALACASGYAGILGAIERCGYDTFWRRVSVTRSDRAAILARAWLRRFPDLAAPRAAPNGAPHATHA